MCCICSSNNVENHRQIWTNVHWDLWIVLRILFAFKLLQGHFPVSVYLISQELIVVSSFCMHTHHT